MTVNKPFLMCAMFALCIAPAYATDLDEARWDETRWSAYGIGAAIYAYEACRRDDDARTLRAGFRKLLRESSLTREQRDMLISMHSDGYLFMKGRVAQESKASLQAGCQQAEDQMDGGIDQLLSQFSETL
jgi:hypothetical protein